ncbi:MAG: SGNH/GDSL hydrolase family protein [Nocardioides sp.]|uniref:SGNH/GDSL hydrolase family protein n=1 Tax=Nocardioides sp. TaxID=35761 RepID=UPI003F079726
MGIGGAARRIAAAAAYGGGGITLLGGAVYGLFRIQAGIAMRTVGPTDRRTPPDASGWYGLRHPGPTIEIALLGDSIVAGYGVETIEETVGAHLATSLTRRSRRRVHLTQFGVVGARSIDLDEQIDRAVPTSPQVAVILIGANDVTKTQRPAVAVRALAEAVRRLREAGIEVLVGTCPDLGTIEPIPAPLRQMARKWSRSLAAAQSIAVVEAGGRTISISDILGPEFEASPATMFGPDRFHPSSEGYWRLAEILTPSVLAAVNGVDAETSPRSYRGEGVLPVANAAAQAAEVGGTEVGGTEVDGSQRGERGRWALLRHRDRTPEIDSESPEASETAD